MWPRHDTNLRGTSLYCDQFDLSNRMLFDMQSVSWAAAEHAFIACNIRLKTNLHNIGRH